MKRLILTAAGVALAAVMSIPASAGDYHKGANLLCSQCHIMHYSQSHGYKSDGTGFWMVPGASGPYEFLLRDEVNNLCLSCHDDSGIAPDVLGTVNTGNEPTDVRLAGFLNRLGVEGKDPTGHTLDILDTAPGSNPPWKAEDENGVGKGLSCVNCHHQHGSAGSGKNAYRNLKTDVGNKNSGEAYVTYNDTAIGTFDATKDVYERAAAAYDESNMDWCEPNTTSSGIGNWCSGCHTNFHGTPGDMNTVGGVPFGNGYEEFLRHPDGGVNIGALGGGHSSLSQYNARVNKVKVMSASGAWNPAGSDVTPTCISCHKAHGNGNAFGLLYRSGGGTLTEDGDSLGVQYENLCAQCHVQASYFAK